MDSTLAVTHDVLSSHNFTFADTKGRVVGWLARRHTVSYVRRDDEGRKRRRGGVDVAEGGLHILTTFRSLPKDMVAETMNMAIAVSVYQKVSLRTGTLPCMYDPCFNRLQGAWGTYKT